VVVNSGYIESPIAFAFFLVPLLCLCGACVGPLRAWVWVCYVCYMPTCDCTVSLSVTVSVSVVFGFGLDLDLDLKYYKYYNYKQRGYYMDKA